MLAFNPIPFQVAGGAIDQTFPKPRNGNDLKACHPEESSTMDGSLAWGRQLEPLTPQVNPEIFHPRWRLGSR